MWKYLALFPLMSAAVGALETDAVYGHHMVLQRGVPVPICGKTEQEGDVVVCFGQQRKTVRPVAGRWEVLLEPMSACAEGRELTVTQGTENIVLQDVVVGEVWLACGQSNMEFRLRQSVGGKEAIATSADSGLRLYHAAGQVPTPPGCYGEEQRELLRREKMYVGSWAVAGPETTPEVSAVGYYFGQELRRGLGDVPVAVVDVANGGSEMAAWLPEDSLRRLCPAALGPHWMETPLLMGWARRRGMENMGEQGEGLHPYRPGFLFRTGIRPWLRFPVAGVIWYQGETDAETDDMEQNTRVMKELILSWQRAFQHPSMPFMMVQLPRIAAHRPESRHWREFRRVQARVAEALPGAECVVTIDLGTDNIDVHPPRKREVGVRLARTALGKVYGASVPFRGPRMVSAEREGNMLRVHTEHAEGMRLTDERMPAGFEVAGADGVYHPAVALLDGQDILLCSPDVAEPCHARYAWAIFLEPNVVNAAGLPMEPGEI